MKRKNFKSDGYFKRIEFTFDLMELLPLILAVGTIFYFVGISVGSGL